MTTNSEYQEKVFWDNWKREQRELLTIETCNTLLRKQGVCGRLCQTCRERCQELIEWETLLNE